MVVGVLLPWAVISDLRRKAKEAQALRSIVAQLKNEAESLTASDVACFANSVQRALMLFKPASSEQDFPCVAKIHAPDILLVCSVEAFGSQDNIEPSWTTALLAASQFGAVLRESDAGSDVGNAASVCKDCENFGKLLDSLNLLTTCATEDVKTDMRSCSRSFAIYRQWSAGRSPGDCRTAASMS